jgi:excisionase family DNA binding protein
MQTSKTVERLTVQLRDQLDITADLRRELAEAQQDLRDKFGDQMPDRVNGLRREVADLERQLAEARTENERLRSAQGNDILSMRTNHTFAHSMATTAQLLGVSRRHLERMVAGGRLRTVRLGQRRLVPHDALEELLSERPSGSEAPTDAAALATQPEEK